jgi:hypothetical protein
MLYIFSCSFVDVQFGCSVISAMSDRSYRPPASDHMTDPNFASTLIVVPSTRGGGQARFLIRDEHRHHFAGAIKKTLTHAFDSPYGSKSADRLHFFGENLW